MRANYSIADQILSGAKITGKEKITIGINNGKLEIEKTKEVSFGRPGEELSQEEPDKLNDMANSREGLGDFEQDAFLEQDNSSPLESILSGVKSLQNGEHQEIVAEAEKNRIDDRDTLAFDSEDLEENPMHKQKSQSINKENIFDDKDNGMNIVYGDVTQGEDVYIFNETAQNQYEDAFDVGDDTHTVDDLFQEPEMFNSANEKGQQNISQEPKKSTDHVMEDNIRAEEPAAHAPQMDKTHESDVAKDAKEIANRFNGKHQAGNEKNVQQPKKELGSVKNELSKSIKEQVGDYKDSAKALAELLKPLAKEGLSMTKDATIGQADANRAVPFNGR